MTTSENSEASRIVVDHPDENSPGGRPSLVRELLGWSKDIVLAVLGAILIVIFVVQPVKVECTSMEPKLEPQDRLFVNKFVYYFSDIGRGDIVVFW